MANIKIRRGTTKVLIVGLDDCRSGDTLWDVFDAVYVRMSQGLVNIDKTLIPLEDDPTAGMVHFSQEDTLKLSDRSRAKIQIFGLTESHSHQLAVKTDVFDVIVLESLWDNEVRGETFSHEDLNILDLEKIPTPISHVLYERLHINISEFAGIISDKSGIIMVGDSLVYDPETETLMVE